MGLVSLVGAVYPRVVVVLSTMITEDGKVVGFDSFFLRSTVSLIEGCIACALNCRVRPKVLSVESVIGDHLWAGLAPDVFWAAMRP